MLEVLEPLAPKFGDTPSIPIGCNRLQSVATDREVWCVNGIIRYRQNSAINAGIGSDMGIVSILRMLINWEKRKIFILFSIFVKIL